MPIILLTALSKFKAIVEVNVAANAFKVRGASIRTTSDHGSIQLALPLGSTKIKIDLDIAIAYLRLIVTTFTQLSFEFRRFSKACWLISAVSVYGRSIQKPRWSETCLDPAR